MNCTIGYNIVDGIKRYPIDTLKSPEEFQSVVDACISDARMERLKGLGVTFLTAAACLTLLTIAYSVSSMATGMLFFPLMLLPFIGNAVSFLGGASGVVGCGYLLYKARGKVMSYANVHFERANAYYAQATDAKKQKAAFATTT